MNSTMPKTKAPDIPEAVQQQVNEIVQHFNEQVIKDPNRYYVPRFKGKFVYVDRLDYAFLSHVCRVKYTGQIDNWDFAIYKYSDGRYDPDEWMFPGSGHIDGTLEGAMKAGLEAYPD